MNCRMLNTMQSALCHILRICIDCLVLIHKSYCRGRCIHCTTIHSNLDSCCSQVLTANTVFNFKISSNARISYRTNKKYLIITWSLNVETKTILITQQSHQSQLVVSFEQLKTFHSFWHITPFIISKKLLLLLSCLMSNIHCRFPIINFQLQLTKNCSGLNDRPSGKRRNSSTQNEIGKI